MPTDIRSMRSAFTHFEDMLLTSSEVASSLRDLPSTPQVLRSLYLRVRGQVSSLQQIGTMLRFDPGMSARVLQLGNQMSASCGDHCFTIEDAINRVGFERIRKLISQVADGQALVHRLSMYGLDADDFWRWSVATALGAELLAEYTGEVTSVAHTIGLVHAVGMMAVDSWSLGRGPTLMFQWTSMPNEFSLGERDLLGFTQAEVGADLLRSWNFPVTMVEAVRWQYDPLRSSGHARMACLLHAAKWLRAAVCADDSVPPPLPAVAVLKTLRLTPEKLVSFVVDLRVRLGESRNSLDQRAA